MPPTSLEASPFGTPIGAIGLPQVPKLIRTLTYFFYNKIVSVLKNIWLTFISFLYNIALLYRNENWITSSCILYMYS